MTGFMTVVIGMSGTKLRTPVPAFTSSTIPTTVSFAWPAVDNATYYEYYTSASGSATSPTALAAGVITKDITVAAGNTTVTFYVRAVGPVIYEKSEYGSVVGLSTKGTLPTPISLSGASTTTTKVTFTWAAGTPAPFDANWTYSYYTVINGTTSATVDGYASTSVAIDVPGIGDTAAIYVLAKGTNYITSGTANTSKAAYGYLAAPTITAQSISATVVRFSWSNPANVLSYQYYTSASGSTSAPIGPITLVSGTTSIDITVANAGNVTIYVQSIGAPYAPSNTWGSVYGSAYLGYSSVGSIAGLPVSTTQVSFTWIGVNTDSYSYYTSVSGSAGSPTGTITDSNKPLTVVSSGANTQVTLYLKSLGNASYMPATSYSSGVGTSYAGTASISNLSATSLTTTTVRFSWNTISNVASFSYRTNIDNTPRTLNNTTTSQDVSTSGIGGSVRFYISAIGANNYMNMAETYLDGSSYGYWPTPSLTYTSTSTTTFTVSWSAASGATYQYSTSTVGRTNTSSSSSQSITVSTAGGNTTVTIYATGGVYAESSASITGYGYIGNASITTPTVIARSVSSVSFSWTGSNITKYYYSSNGSSWIDNGTTTTASLSATAGGSVTIYVKGDASANYAPASNVSASGTAKSGYSGVTGLSGVGATYTTVTFSWTSSNAGSYNYYTSADSTVRNTTNTSITVSNGGTTGASVTFYIIGITNNANYDTPSAYQQASANAKSIDTTPDAFSFGSVTGSNLSTSKTSATVTLTGIDAGQTTTISVTGGTVYYSSNNATFSSTTSSNVPISTDNKYLYVTGTSSSSYGTDVVVSVTYGGTTGTFKITTLIIDTTPNSFSFTPKYGARPNEIYTSPIGVGVVTVGGMDANRSVPVSVSGGRLYWSSIPSPTQVYDFTYVENGSTTITTDANGQMYVLAYGTASSTYSTKQSVVVTIGGVQASYDIVTAYQADTTPDDFSFASTTGIVSYNSNWGGEMTFIPGLGAYTLVPITTVGGGIYWNTTGAGGYGDGTVGDWSYTGTTTDTGNAITGAGGVLYVKPIGQSPSGPGLSRTVTITIGGVTRTWTISAA